MALNQAVAFYPAGLISAQHDEQVAYLPIEGDNQQDYDIVALSQPGQQSPLLKALMQQFSQTKL
ncbi:transcription regulator, LysR family [Lactiplantibacillus pentosus KCA1]|nr:hypothetical protein [Lactiplantibacillus pentosus]EIW12853.1 transcription regulator, LysR family [Lactiplantibacillus pentosus KCA1]